MRKVDRHFFQAIKQKKSVEEVNDLISKGANVRSCNSKAINLCIQNNLPHILELIISKGADVHACNFENIANCIVSQHEEVFEILVNAGLNVRQRNDYLLQWASRYGTAQMVKTMIDNGANVEANDGASLRIAVTRKKPDVVVVLLRAGAKNRNLNIEEALFI